MERCHRTNECVSETRVYWEQVEDSPYGWLTADGDSLLACLHEGNDGVLPPQFVYAPTPTKTVRQLYSSGLAATRGYRNTDSLDGSGSHDRGRKRPGQVYEDYKMAFGEEPLMISGVAIMTDTDNTKEQATAYYGDILFKKALP